jgi:hypothetical protein
MGGEVLPLEGDVKALGLLMLLGVSAGCGGPFGLCTRETIEVRLAGSVAASGVVTPVESRDAVAPSNFEEFDLVRRILIQAESVPRLVIWTATIFGEQSGAVSVFMPGTVGSGQVLPLRATSGGGWGTFPLGAQTDAQVSFGFDGFVAATIQGTLTVEATRPLRVRLRFTASDASTSTRAVDLTATFNYTRNPTPCT